MDDTTDILIFVGIAAAALLLASGVVQAGQYLIDSNGNPVLDSNGNPVLADTGAPVDTTASATGTIDMTATWKVGAYPTYAQAISDAEVKYSIPTDLLARLLYQESGFRPEVISGAVRSSVGAIGIAQFMPTTAADLHINPLDPVAAIDAAGLYLSRLHHEFGSWVAALGAYNFGAGNYIKYEKGAVQLPTETVNYIAEITSDVQVT